MLAAIDLEAVTVPFPQMSPAASWDARLEEALSRYGNALGSKVVPLFRRLQQAGIPAELLDDALLTPGYCTAKEGQTWETAAEEWLGDAAYLPVLVTFNYKESRNGEFPLAGRMILVSEGVCSAGQ